MNLIYQQYKYHNEVKLNMNTFFGDTRVNKMHDVIVAYKSKT